MYEVQLHVKFITSITHFLGLYLVAKFVNFMVLCKLDMIEQQTYNSLNKMHLEQVHGTKQRLDMHWIYKIEFIQMRSVIQTPIVLVKNI